MQTSGFSQDQIDIALLRHRNSPVQADTWRPFNIGFSEWALFNPSGTLCAIGTWQELWTYVEDNKGTMYERPKQKELTIEDLDLSDLDLDL